MGKEVKTNAVRILDRNKVDYELKKYECDDFKDGVSIADMLGQSYDMSFKTLVTVGKSGKYYVFAIPVDKEMDMKKASCERHKCSYRLYKGRMYSNRYEKELSYSDK